MNERTNPRLSELLITASDPYEACKGAHAVAILTEWDEFKEYDYQKIYDSMTKPAFIFDGRHIVDDSVLRKIGFEVYCIGKPTSKFF